MFYISDIHITCDVEGPVSWRYCSNVTSRQLIFMLYVQNHMWILFAIHFLSSLVFLIAYCYILMYQNVRLRHVCLTTVAQEINTYYVFWMCVC